MNRLIIFTICTFFFCACKAQKGVPPPIEKIELVTHKGIQYKLPDNIELALNKAIEKEENNIHIIRFSTVNDSTYTLMVYCLNNGKGETTTTNQLIKNTGRYYQYKSKQVPIIFDTDYKFSTPSFVITHSCYWITFKFKNNKGIIQQEE